MRNLVSLEFCNQPVSVITQEDGSLWWIASEVCAILGISNVSDAVKRLLPEESMVYRNTDALHSELKMLLVNEPGLYRLIFRSNKPEAKTFQRWVFHDILPQIRRTGGYFPETTMPPSRTEELAYLRTHIAFLESLGMCEDRDKLMLADMARNLLIRGVLLPHSTTAEGQHPVMPFFVADRIRALGHSLSRKQEARLIPTLAKKVAKEYRLRYGTDPRQCSRFVDGATRLVNVYSAEDAIWIDAIVQSSLVTISSY